MRLRVILRLTPSENQKNRPSWYSKETCLRSLLAAIDAARAVGLDVDLSVFLDVSSGRSVSPGVTRLLDRADTVTPIRGGTAAKSWRPVVRMVRDGVPFADDDLLYFIEDDYLHQPEALIKLVDGDADYRLLYVHEGEHGSVGEEHDGWADAYGGTSSFAVTGAAFRADASRHLLLSHGGGAWDELSWRGVGSHVTPPGLSYVLWPFTSASRWPRKWGLRPLRHAVGRIVALQRSIGRSRTIRLRLPVQATHAELALLAGEADWPEIASRYTSAPQPTPTLTMVLIVRNERDLLRRTLGTLPADDTLDVLIVDELSTDGGAELAQDIAKESPNVRLLRLLVPCRRELLLIFARSVALGTDVGLIQPGDPLSPAALQPLTEVTPPRR